MQQFKVSQSAKFITLTYDTTTIPISGKGFRNLNPTDLQLFFKRLRKAHEHRPDAPTIKYYAVGEYGTKSWRPHYHVCLFNAQLDLIQPAWGLGSIHYGDLNHASVGYTLKYMSKPPRIPLHRNDDRHPEFSRMSKGLGASYLSDNIRAWHL